MPLNPAIILQGQLPQMSSPFEDVSKVLSLQNLLQQRQIGGQTLQENQMKLQQMKQSAQDEQTVRQILSQNPDIKTAFPQMLQAIGTRAIPIAKQIFEQDQAQKKFDLESQKTTAEIAKTNADISHQTTSDAETARHNRAIEQPKPSGDYAEFLGTYYPGWLENKGEPKSAKNEMLAYKDFLAEKRAPKLLTPEEEAQQIRIRKAGASFSTNEADLNETAGAIIRGEATPDLTKYSFRDRTAIEARLSRAGFNQAKMSTEFNAVQKYMTTANGAQQLRLRQAVEKIEPHVDMISNLYSQLEKKGLPSGFKLWNRAALAAARNTPGEAGAIATNLEAQINDLAAELGNIYMGGNTPTDHALQMARTNLSTDWNPQTFKMALDLIRKNVGLRRNAIRFTGPAGVPSDSPYIPQETVPSGATGAKPKSDPLGIF